MRPLKRNVRGAARRERVRVDFVEQWARGAQRREPAGQLAPVSVAILHMNNEIAKLDLILEKASGERFPVRVKIGSPYEIKDNKGFDFAKCPVSLKGLHDKLSDIAGENTFQALTLAIIFIRTMLTYFVEDGGKIFLSDGKAKFEFDSYFKKFGH